MKFTKTRQLLKRETFDSDKDWILYLKNCYRQMQSLKRFLQKELEEMGQKDFTSHDVE